MENKRIRSDINIIAQRYISDDIRTDAEIQIVTDLRGQITFGRIVLSADAVISVKHRILPYMRVAVDDHVRVPQMETRVAGIRVYLPRKHSSDLIETIPVIKLGQKEHGFLIEILKLSQMDAIPDTIVVDAFCQKTPHSVFS